MEPIELGLRLMGCIPSLFDLTTPAAYPIISKLRKAVMQRRLERCGCGEGLHAEEKPGRVSRIPEEKTKRGFQVTEAGRTGLPESYSSYLC